MPRDISPDIFCRLDATAGRERICPEGACSFWEPGGAVIEGRCAFEQVDLEGRPSLVCELLRLRGLLDAASNGERDEGASHEYHRVLNESSEE